MENKPKLILMCDIPTSGKSSFAKEYLKSHKETIRVSRDDFRLMFRNEQSCKKEIEAIISLIQFETINSSLGAGYDVIVDNTNCKLSYINGLIDYFKKTADIKVKLIEIPLEEALSRNLERSKISGIFVPPFIIENMYNNLQELKKNFDFEKYKL